MREVVIRTGSRLHFGLFALNPEHERQFGGIGMMIDDPGVCARVEPSDKTTIIGDEAIVDRVNTFTSRFRETYPQTPPVRIEVSQFIPAHSGLGSGTQLALAVGAALAELANIDCSPIEIAIATGRGRRSAIGIHGFQHGGFLVDGGHSPNEAVGQMMQRIEVPADWRIVLISPNDAHGLSGQSELDAFSRLPPMPATLTTELRGLVTNEIVPALRDADFDRFTQSLHSFGQQIGQYFAPVQGGVFRSPQATNLADALTANNVQAIVQSSWGPTVCAFARNATDVQRILSLLDGVSATVAKPMNSGHVAECL